MNASYEIRVSADDRHFKVVHLQSTQPELGCLRDFDEVECCDGGTWRAAVADLIPVPTRRLTERIVGVGPAACPICRLVA